MNPQFQPSFLDRLLIRAPVRRLALSGVGRSLHLNRRYDRRMRRVRNRALAARVATRLAAKSPMAATRSMVSAGQLSTEPSSSITTRFIVLSEGRSGSTLLIDELNRRWPEIRSKGEEFSHLRRGPLDDFVSVARRTFIEETGESIVGCKIFALQVSEQELESLLRLDGMRVVILRRRNLLRRYTSFNIALKTSEWHGNQFRLRNQALTAEKRSITIDTKDLIEGIITSDNRFRRFESATEGLPRIEVWYEDLSADLDAELRRVATFLGAGPPAHESPPKLSKQNPEPLRELITNYDEVSEFLEDVGLAEFLIEEDRADESLEVAAEDNRDVLGTDRDRWPDESQLHLLRALIGPEDSFEANWAASLATKPMWASSPGAADMYPSVHRRLRMFPHLARNLHDFRMESIRNSMRKMRLLDVLGELTDRCSEVSLAVTLLGPTALMAMMSEQDRVGFRTLPISGLDLGTSSEQFDSVTETLLRLGWAIGEATDPTASEANLERDGLELRLHRRMLRATTTVAGPTTDLELDLHTGLVPVATFGPTVSIPAPAELFLTIIIDGLFAGTSASMNWILDTHRLIADTGDDLDWNRLATITITHRLQAPIRSALTLLDDITTDLLTPTALAAIETMIVTEQQSNPQQAISRP